MSIQQSESRLEDFLLDKSLKYDYHGNKYSLFIGGLDPGTSEVEIMKNIENIGVTDIIDVVVQRNNLLESKRYAEVHLFSIDSVKLIQDKYPGQKNVFSFNTKSKIFLEDFHFKKLYLSEKIEKVIQSENNSTLRILEKNPKNPVHLSSSFEERMQRKLREIICLRRRSLYLNQVLQKSQCYVVYELNLKIWH